VQEAGDSNESMLETGASDATLFWGGEFFVPARTRARHQRCTAAAAQACVTTRTACNLDAFVSPLLSLPPGRACRMFTSPLAAPETYSDLTPAQPELPERVHPSPTATGLFIVSPLTLTPAAWLAHGLVPAHR